MEPFRLRHGAHTQAGRRPTNQDGVLVEVLADGRTLLALADGMGGHRAGEEASRVALTELGAEVRAGRSLVEAFRTANHAVYTAGQERPEWKGMGTTLVALLVEQGSYAIANVGDSRAYRLSAAGVIRLTADHSVLEEARRTGPEAVRAVDGTKWKHALTRAVGTEPEVEVDSFGPFSASEAHAVLLCSDGLYEVIPEAALGDFAEGLEEEDLDTAARALADRAYEGGSTDNISVVLGSFGSHGPGRPEPAGSPLGTEPVRRSIAAAPRVVPLVGLEPESRARRRRRGRMKGWVRQYDPVLAVAIVMIVSGLLLWFL